MEWARALMQSAWVRCPSLPSSPSRHPECSTSASRGARNRLRWKPQASTKALLFAGNQPKRNLGLGVPAEDCAGDGAAPSRTISGAPTQARGGTCAHALGLKLPLGPAVQNHALRYVGSDF
jgi:hypothetical protein